MHLRLPVALVLVALIAAAPATGSSGGALGREDAVAATASASWAWPLTPSRVVVAYAAPADRYGAGHRGIDLAASLHASVTAPAPGVVAFSASVVDRGVVTIEHADGLVSTFEPVTGTLEPGTAVVEGDVIGTVDAGGHTPVAAMHFGVRQDGEYVNPLTLLGGIPRAVLLTCC